MAMPPGRIPEAAAPPFAEDVDVIARAMRNFSLETTRPTGAEIAALHGVVPQGAAIYLSAVPSRPDEEMIESAIRIAEAGFKPVPHLAARSFRRREVLDSLLARLARSACVNHVLVIAGDYPRPLGPFGAAIDVIESGILPQHGITEIGVAAYPDGHPRIPDYELMRIVTAKIDAAEAIGLHVSIVTQFGFDAGAMLSWLERLRSSGIDQPVRLGMAGPTNPTALLTYAHRCGVKASAQGLARHAGLAKHLFGGVTPDGIVRALALRNAQDALGQVTLHLYSFGGLAASGRWAAAVAAGRVALDRADGFSVAPWSRDP